MVGIKVRVVARGNFVPAKTSEGYPVSYDRLKGIYVVNVVSSDTVRYHLVVYNLPKSGEYP